MGSTNPALQCTDLARELREIDVVTNDNVPIGVTNHDVVAQHFPLSGIASLNYAPSDALLGKQLVHATQCEATAILGRNSRHEQAGRPSLPGPERWSPKSQASFGADKEFPIPRPSSRPTNEVT